MPTLAIVLATLSMFVLGGLWYSPWLFGRLWCRLAGVDPDNQHRHPARVFAVAGLFGLLGAVAFALLLPPGADLVRSVELGLLVGFGVAATSFGINYQFADRDLRLWLIDGGYHTLQFALYGLVFGALA